MMKLILPLTAALMLGAVTGTMAQEVSWDIINPPGHAGHYSGLAFPTRDTGFAVSEPANFTDPWSTFLRTEDGGENWTKSTIQGMWASDLAFYDVKRGFAIGQNLDCGCGSLETTTDGGKTWTEKTFAEVKGLGSISLPDKTTGIISAGSSTIYRTTDAGATWRKITLNLGEEVDFGPLSFPTPTVGYMLGVPKGRTLLNVLYKTTDGGLTWKKIHDGGAGGGTTLYQNLAFTTPDVGVITGRIESKAIFKTTDGGATWKRVYKPTLPETAVMAGVTFPSAKVGYACGSDGTIVRTGDGGDTWQREHSGTTGTLSGMAFLDEKTGFVGGLSGLLLKRTETELPTGSLDHTALDFGTVPSNRTKEMTATISAANGAGLRIANITVIEQEGTAFTLLEPADGYPIDIAPGSPLTMKFRFAPGAAGAHYATTVAIETNDPANGTMQMSLSGEGSGAVASVDEAVAGKRLGIRCLPNPATDKASVTIDLPHAAQHMRVALFNTLGEPVATLHDGPADAGTHSYTVNAETLPSGYYYCIVHAGELTGVREISITR